MGSFDGQGGKVFGEGAFSLMPASVQRDHILLGPNGQITSIGSYELGGGVRVYALPRSKATDAVPGAQLGSGDAVGMEEAAIPADRALAGRWGRGLLGVTPDVGCLVTSGIGGDEMAEAAGDQAFIALHAAGVDALRPVHSADLYGSE